ncbi:MAG: IS110 family transposase [Syntrophales bacterium]
MSERDYNRQAARRQRISKATLIVGVDVGKAFNAVGFMNKDDNVLGSCAKLYNNREGFEQFVKMIEGLKAKHRLRDVLVGMEPTGHYWRKLAYFTKEHGYEVRFVRITPEVFNKSGHFLFHRVMRFTSLGSIQCFITDKYMLDIISHN